MGAISGFSKVEQAIILLAFTMLFSILLFLYETINTSNIFTMFVELGFAGVLGFILARYYFNKDRDLQARENNEKEEKLRNDFEYRLRTAHVKMSQEINMAGAGILPSVSISTLIGLLDNAVLTFKNYRPIDIDYDKMLKYASALIEKHEEIIKNDVLLLDLKTSLDILEQIGEEYHIDLTQV